MAITRAQMRRQLRRNGGIMNAVPRQGYFLGSIGRAIGKAVGKVGDVAKQVVKSPVGKAALLGLGAYGLGGGFGPGGFGFGNIGPSIGRGLGSLRSGLFGAVSPNLRAAGMPSFLGETGFTSTKGILGKLGLTGGGGKMMPTALGMISSASLLGYFVQKGATEEEAKELAQDVYRGKGLGLDQIRADIAKYKSGEFDYPAMTQRGYDFLTPRPYLAAQGGRVGLYAGTPEEGIKSLEAGASPITVEGDVRPENMKVASNYNNPSDDYIIDMEESMAIFQMYPQDLSEQQQIHLYGYKKYAQGGRVGLYAGTQKKKKTKSKAPGPHKKTKLELLKETHPTLFSDTTTSIEGSPKKKKYTKGRAQGGRIGYDEGSFEPLKYTSKIKEMWAEGYDETKGDLPTELLLRIGLTVGAPLIDIIRTVGKLHPTEVGKLTAATIKQGWDLNKTAKDIIEEGRAEENAGGRIGKFGGGIGTMMPRIPTGMPRVNAGGITELDYRQEGGYVPMGVKEKADDVPAMLSKNEFVMTADAVKGAGGGSVEKGAQRMYDTMKRLENRIA